MRNLPISAVIPTKNAERTVEDCLTSVQRNNPAEIIVVDGNSSDRTVEIARRYTEKIYSDEGRGINYAGQLGAEQATQEYVAYIDSDITLPQGTLATLLAELKASDCVSMQAKVIGANCVTYLERGADWSIRLLQARRGGGLSAAVLRKDTILKYKLDSFVKVGSDYEFQLRMEREGGKLGTSSALVYHHHKADMKSFVKQRFRYGQEATRFIQKYGPWQGGFWSPLVMLYWIATCLVKGKPHFIPFFIVSGISGTMGMLRGFTELIGERVKMIRGIAR